MKILYASDRSMNAKIQLERFLQNVDRNKHTIKIAAYRGYYPNNSQVDWNLDCLLRPSITEYSNTLNNSYLNIYLDQVKRFAPDLIISDIESYTTFVATQLNITLWHVSNKLCNHAIEYIYKRSLGLHKSFSALYISEVFTMQLDALISKANKNYVYSHWGDILEVPLIKDSFEWIRPYYVTGKPSAPGRHDCVIVDINHNPNILSLLRKTKDTVFFTPRAHVEYDKINVKSIYDIEEYGCNVYNSDLFVCDGSASLLADAVYNNKQMMLVPDTTSKDNLFNYLMYNNIYNYLIKDDIIEPIQLDLKPGIKFLHQQIDAL